VLLSLDGGSLRFFKNGAQHGPGCQATEQSVWQVAGPVVAHEQLRQCKRAINYKSTSVRLLSNAQHP
jgi:hypothetical protein